MFNRLMRVYDDYNKFRISYVNHSMQIYKSDNILEFPYCINIKDLNFVCKDKNDVLFFFSSYMYDELYSKYGDSLKCFCLDAGLEYVKLSIICSLLGKDVACESLKELPELWYFKRNNDYGMLTVGGEQFLNDIYRFLDRYGYNNG